jgi:co-chaperonin GroES (HSP10)
MDIKPIGNRIIVKKLSQEQSTSSGIILTVPNANGVNVWGTIVALPPKSYNHFIDQMEVGGEVLYKQFQADSGSFKGAVENFEVLDVEPSDGSRQGQVLAYRPPQIK